MSSQTIWPGCAKSTAVAIRAATGRNADQRFDDSTTTAMLRPVKFCW